MISSNPASVNRPPQAIEDIGIETGLVAGEDGRTPQHVSSPI